MRRASSFVSVAGTLAIFAAALAVHVSDIRRPATAKLEIETSAAVETFIRSGYRDVEGRLLPLLVHADHDHWLAPVPVYLGALAAQFSTSAERLRLATAAVAALTVLMLAAVVWYAFDRPWLALVAAAMLLLTPAHLIYARTFSGDGIWHALFCCGWLLALVLAQRAPGSPWPLVWCVVVVAGSIYSQASAALILPMLAGLSCVALWQRRRLSPRDVGVMLAAAAMVFLPMLWWLARYPSTYAETLGRWFLHPAHLLHPFQALESIANWSSLTSLASIYWDFFSPMHLALNPTSPALAGVYLFPVPVLMLVGTYATLWPEPSETRDHAHRTSLVALLAFVTLPIAAAAFNEQRAIGRVLSIVPMGIVVATYGLHFMSKSVVGRVMAVTLLVAAAMQFWSWRIA